MAPKSRDLVLNRTNLEKVPVGSVHDSWNTMRAREIRKSITCVCVRCLNWVCELVFMATKWLCSRIHPSEPIPPPPRVSLSPAFLWQLVYLTSDFAPHSSGLPQFRAANTERLAGALLNIHVKGRNSTSAFGSFSNSWLYFFFFY